ncbi:MAG: phage/plasmid primase, P4 family [Vicinamibacterales bacterium]|nr:phage/plasmid primase, P4 family [Vicinamibacterales bacterium]
MTLPRATLDENETVQRTLELLCPYGPVELRVLVNGGMRVERFEQHARAAAWLRPLHSSAKTTYVVLNPFNIQTINGKAVADADIEQRCWLLIDVDPHRPANSNSTDAELAASQEMAEGIKAYLASLGWPAPVECLSGNGVHLLYRIELPNDDPSRILVENILRHLAEKFDTTAVHVDTTVGNASRITKLYGTVARKGPHSDERPHRQSAIWREPSPLEIVPLAQLQQASDLAQKASVKKPSAKKEVSKATEHTADIIALLVEHYPPDGERYKFYEALAGFFLGSLKLDPDVARTIIDTAADHAGDHDTSPRPAYWIQRTLARLNDGEKCIGGPQVAELIGEHGPAVVTQIRAWVGVAAGADLVLSPGDPMPSAEAFVVRAYTVDDIHTLHHQSGVFYGYQPEAGAYQHRDEPTVRADLYKFLKPAQRWIAATSATPRHLAPFQPTKSKVENVLDALRAVCNLPTSQMPPYWLHRAYGDLDPRDMLAFTNGLLHVPTRTLYMPTPHFFTLNGLDFAYDPWAQAPAAWLTFLKQLWPSDSSSIEMLQEMFGYLLTPDTSFQKGFMLHGPKRSGKGIIGRIVRRLVGERNACSPTLAAFGESFGKQVLIGKTLAAISDARISLRTDTAKVAETLLSIIGEDAQTVARKFLEDWNGPLYVRFLILTNELPHINDASGALASRFLLLTLTESFYGKEDLNLFNTLAPELPSIALWALEGRDRLYKRGHFVQPTSADQLRQELEDLSSPVGVFLRTHTVCEPGATVPKKTLFAQWGLWCSAHGVEHAGTDATFGRNVRAILPSIRDHLLGGRGAQERHWEGVRLIATLVKPEAGDAGF